MIFSGKKEKACRVCAIASILYLKRVLEYEFYVTRSEGYSMTVMLLKAISSMYTVSLFDSILSLYRTACLFKVIVLARGCYLDK